MSLLVRALFLGILLAGLRAGAAPEPTRKLSPVRPPLPETRPTLTFVAVPLDSTAERALSTLWLVGEQGLARSSRFEAISITDALDPAGRKDRAAKPAEAEAAFALGMKRYNDLDSQSALTQFDRAVRAAEQTDLTRSFSLLSRAQVMRVAALVANGSHFLVDNEIERVLALNPRAQFSTDQFPPEWMAKAERQRRLSLEGGKAKLRVKTNVPAQVALNGQFRGMSPITVSGLMRPEQYVTLKAPGYVLEQRRVLEPQVEWTLRRAPEWRALETLTGDVRADPSGPGRDAALQKFAAAVDSDQVVLFLARGMGTGLSLTALRVDAKDGHTYGYREQKAETGDALLQQADAALTAVLTEDVPRDDGRPVHHVAKGTWGRRQTGYVLIGAGAAAVVAGTVVAVRSARLHRSTPLGVGIGVDVVGLAAAGLGTYWSFFEGASAQKKDSAAPAEPPPPPLPSVPASPAKSKSVAAPPPPPIPAAATAPAPKIQPDEVRHREEIREQLERETQERQRQKDEQRRMEDEAKRREDERRREKDEDLRYH